MSECHHFDHGAATGTVTRLAKECPFCRIETLERLLKSVQSDPGNWLHSELLEAIEAAVGPAADTGRWMILASRPESCRQRSAEMPSAVRL